ncbi:MAG: polysaccharide biosynthesis C-terminal domain-containing protein [Chloroflexi bacterium]|nr:polysaccharide biosynthesis C-terminal domain-containing protein [Chloroflexota bacterium]
MDLARGSLLALVYRATGMAFWVALGIITARALSLSDLGVYVSTVVVIQSVGAVVASFASASGYFVTRRHRPPGEVASNALLLALLMGGGVFVLGLMGWVVYQGEYRSLLLLSGLALLPIVGRHALGGVFLGTNRLWQYNFSIHGPAYAAVVLLLVWVVALDHRTTEGALAAWIGGQYVSFAVLLLMGRSWWAWFAHHQPDWRLIGGFVSFGAVTGLAGFVSFFNYRVDQLLVAGLDGSTGAGIYSRAVAAAEALWLFSTSIAVASYSSIGSLTRQEAAALTSRSVRHTLFIVSSGAVVLFLLAPFLLSLMFGPRYEAAATSLRILCVGTALFAPQTLLANYFTVQMGRPWISLSIAAVSCLINIGVSMILIPRVGYVGGAWATTISYVAVAAMAVVIFLRTSDARFSDLWRIRRDDIATYGRLAGRLWSQNPLRRQATGPGSAP